MKYLQKKCVRKWSLTGIVVRDKDVQLRWNGGHDFSDLCFDSINFTRHGTRGIDHDGKC